MRDREKVLRASAYLLVAATPFAGWAHASGALLNPNHIYYAANAVAVLGTLTGAIINQAPHRRGWYLIALGNASFALGDILYVQMDAAGSLGFPDIPDIPYLLGYPVIVAGFAILGRGRAAEKGNLVDAAIVATGLGLAAWGFLMSPYAADAGMALAPKLVSMAYPMGDLLLLAAVCWFAIGARRTPTVGLLLVSMLALVVSDVIYWYSVLFGEYVGGWMDVGYIINYLLPAAAVIHPSVRKLELSEQGETPTVSRRRIVLLAAAALVGPSVLMASDLHSRLDVIVILSGTILLFLLALIRIVGLIRAVERHSKQLSEQRAKLATALEELKVVEEERRKLLDALMHVAEAERTAVASNLHDGPVQKLTALGYELEFTIMDLRDAGATREADRLEVIDDALSEQIADLRSVMVDLRPPVLDERGLAAALRDRANQFGQENEINVTTDLVGIRPGRDIETLLYRVGQEALTNIAKHAQASNVEISLHGTDDEIELQVCDDGVGFHVSDADDKVRLGHIGLVSMRERVELAGGSWSVASEPGAGTRLRIVLPTTDREVKDAAPVTR